MSPYYTRQASYFSLSNLIILSDTHYLTCLLDLDECELGTDNCTASALNCTNTEGGFMCTCAVGYNGTSADDCTGERFVWCFLLFKKIFLIHHSIRSFLYILDCENSQQLTILLLLRRIYLEAK